MTIVDEPATEPGPPTAATPAGDSPPEAEQEAGAPVAEAAPGTEPQAEPVPEDVPEAVVLPGAPNGLRIRRVRLKSVVKLGSVFFVLGYLVTMASLVLLWNIGQRLGFVDDAEDLVETSLGLDSFEVVGQDLFDLAVIGVGLVFAMGLAITVLLAIVYNAACLLLGGLAVETGPLRRPHKVFSFRHRRFIEVR